MDYEYVFIQLKPLAKYLFWVSKKFDIFRGMNFTNISMRNRELRVKVSKMAGWVKMFKFSLKSLGLSKFIYYPQIPCACMHLPIS